jgi:hypothetical protein
VPIFSDGMMPATLVGYRAPLSQGDAGVAQTVQVMRQLIDQDLANPDFVNFAKTLVANVPAHDEWAEVEAIYNWVHNNIRFVKDPYTKETLYPPSELLKLKSGDCDDISMLLGALYLAVGYPARLATVSANAQSPGEFSHVFPEVEVPPDSNNWVAADAARPGSQFGVHPPEYYRKRVWSLYDDSYQDLQGVRRQLGLGYIRYRTLGLGQDYSDIISQALSETPQMMAVAQGLPSSATLPGQSTVITGGSSPYSSFMTPYSPGYGIPTAGYSPSTLALTASGSDWIWPLLLAGVVIMLASQG